MERSIIEENIKSIYHIDAVPLQLMSKAESLYFQSTTLLPLKPNQEPARIHLSCVTAKEMLSSMPIPTPDISRPPIPPTQYKKLLNQFRAALLPNNTVIEEPKTPRRKRTARMKPSNFSELELGVDFDDDDNYVDNHLTGAEFKDQTSEDENYELQFSTPRKRAPITARFGSPSPRKSLTRSPRKGVPPPNKALIETLGLQMGIQKVTIDAVIHAYNVYIGMVKDSWGLLYGLFIVIVERVEPRLGTSNENSISKVFRTNSLPQDIDTHEWRSWCERIIAGQTWICQIAQNSEKSPDLLGSAGGWGLGVEFSL